MVPRKRCPSGFGHHNIARFILTSESLDVIVFVYQRYTTVWNTRRVSVIVAVGSIRKIGPLFLIVEFLLKSKAVTEKTEN